MLRELDSSIWINEVDFRLFGVNFGNRMTCIKLSDGSLWLHSPTKFTQSTYEEIKAKGDIQFLVTPSLMHNLFVMDWKAQDNSAQIFAPAKAKKLESDIKLDEISNTEIEKLFNQEISCIPINGLPTLQEYAFIHHASKTLILTDLAFNFGSESSGWAKILLKMYGAYNKFGPSIGIRSVVKDKQAFSESLKIIAGHHFCRIIVSHGHVIEDNGNAIFNEAFGKYLNN